MSAFVHMELSTTDPEAAKRFYKDLFGWKLTDQKMADGSVYTMFDTRSGPPGGGIMRTMAPEQPTAWMGYVGVKSAKKSMEKARSLGATPIIEYKEIPGYGAFGIFIDPTGATLAVWEPFAPPATKKKPAKKTTKKTSRRKKK
ncbi:MAG TPA: VOC family protein [Thermoanaerobaculia bacterium]